MNNIIALIPARGGSKRLPRKNIKSLGGHPLLSYSIEVALQSKIFDGVYVSTDDIETEAIAQYYGATVIKRPKDFAKDESPDIEWITHALANIPHADYFMILRPTNPFRTVEMIKQAWEHYKWDYWLKGVERVSQHPEKMWNLTDDDDLHNYVGSRRHDRQTNTLDEVYVQNGSIEIRPTDDLRPSFIQPYFTKEHEGDDINSEKDWIYALHLVATGKVKLIEIDKKPWVSPA